MKDGGLQRVKADVKLQNSADEGWRVARSLGEARGIPVCSRSINGNIIGVFETTFCRGITACAGPCARGAAGSA